VFFHSANFLFSSIGPSEIFTGMLMSLQYRRVRNAIHQETAARLELVPIAKRRYIKLCT
jgi:hypothetical protein